MQGHSSDSLCKLFGLKSSELSDLLRDTSERTRASPTVDVLGAHRMLMDMVPQVEICEYYHCSWARLRNAFHRFGLKMPAMHFSCGRYICRRCGILLTEVFHHYGDICDPCWHDEHVLNWQDEELCATTFGWRADYDRNWYLRWSAKSLWAPIEIGEKFEYPWRIPLTKSS